MHLLVSLALRLEGFAAGALSSALLTHFSRLRKPVPGTGQDAPPHPPALPPSVFDRQRLLSESYPYLLFSPSSHRVQGSPLSLLSEFIDRRRMCRTGESRFFLNQGRCQGKGRNSHSKCTLFVESDHSLGPCGLVYSLLLPKTLGCQHHKALTP